jgi:two-component system sensor histidine kinase FlrB
MLPSSHLKPINPSPAENPEAKTALLTSAFSEFISASSRLENAYRLLQGEVSQLKRELEERNTALSHSLAENEHMRLDLQQILDSMPCGVLVLNCYGEITMVNPECGRLLGLPKGERATLLRLSQTCGVNLESFCTAKENVQEFCIHEPGGKRWIEVRTRPLSEQGPGWKAGRSILILRDVTAQRRAEQERGAAREAMALAEITTVLAHEIRNPLASLELFAELIENDDGLRHQWISNLRAGIRNLSGTVNNVLSFHGSNSLKLTPVSLPAVIGNAVQFVKPLAQQAAVSLEWMVDYAQPWVMGNESALQQVVLNLISNAIRHTPKSGTVSVSLKVASARAILEFCDTGCGIRPEHMERIFEPGFSGSGDTSGLGLAVCLRIVRQHGGEICVSNRIDRGARFAVSLPLLHQEVGAA